MDTLLSDLRYGLKMLWKSKGVTIVAIVSLAAGIGANSAIFSIVNSVLLRPRPIANPEQVVELYVGHKDHPYETTSYPSYLDFRDRNEVFTGLAAYGIRQFKLGGANEVEQIWGEAVSANYFDVLGVPASRGRTFLPEENAVPNRNPVVVISHGLWQRRFNSDPLLVGQTITIDRQPFTVVGVAPPQYTGMIRGLSSEIWMPAMMMPLIDPSGSDSFVTSRGSRWLTLVGRLKPDTTIEQARARFDLFTKEMQEAHPEEWRKQRENSIRELFVTVVPESQTRVHPQMTAEVYAGAALLFVIVNLVLVIACMNLASMLLARAVARRSEIAVRLALGASRRRIVRQLLTESVLLSTIAGAAGILLAVWLLNLLMAFIPALPEGIRIALDLRLDWHVVVYTIAVSTFTGLVFGLAPALQSSKADVATVLKDDSTVSTIRYRKSRLRKSLVVAQVAFSLLLLIGAGLVLRSLEKLRPTRLGFSSDNVVAGQVSLNERDYDRRKGHEFYRNVTERVAALPGVQNVSLYEGIPGGFIGGSRRTVDIEGYKPQPGESLHLDAAFAGPHYFTNMKYPFVRGRDFDERDQDGAPCVAIVNEVFAAKYFSDTGASLGKHLSRGTGRNNEKQSCEIVGVMRDNNWQSLQTETPPFFALAVMQWEFPRMTLLVNTAGDPKSLVAPVRRVIQQLDPNMPVNDVQTIADQFSVYLYPFRMLAAVMAGCGLMALLLATVGIYGVVSYSVAQRTREVGIRMALGAARGDILKLIVGQGMILVAAGLGMGLLLGFALTRVLTSAMFDTGLLFGVSATDTLTFAGVTLMLGFVALAACYLPALRATKVDPVMALRNS
ncbi:MAG TPA: ABC transporter permease [Pyrinomonadaceae bacterium]|nr:ABC transporter permease [Pyrinomonadaceae bacterium]